MAKSKYKEEKEVHDNLLNLLKEHFFEDEMEIADEEEGDLMKPMSKMMGLKRGKKSVADDDMEYEGDDESYESEGEDDDYYEDLMEDQEEESEEEDEERNLSKDKRKNMAIVLVTKKAGRGKA